MRRYLSKPLESMAQHYDVVVVGSGYGGAITASRLARAGRRVCVLERGKERHAGDFAEGPTRGLGEVQARWPDGGFGAGTALFDFNINPDVSVLTGCGLGGTSLINACVAMKPDPRVWDDPVWPQRIREDEEGLVRGMERAWEMLRPAPLPDRYAPNKTRAMQRSAEHMGAKFERLPITVNFTDGVNHVGVEQATCNLCGNCVGGCNVGAKNTLMMNYLPDAWNHGAEIFTRTCVRRVERRGERWVVHFEILDPGRSRFGAHDLFVAADNVVLAAGSLGSTEILLRSREAGLSMSDRIGHGFTGNGDVLGFAYNADIPISGVGMRHRKVTEGPGPCITSVIDLRDTERLEDGMVIQEGVIPSTLSLVLATSLMSAARAVGVDTDEGFKDYAAEKFREIQAVVPGGSTGSVGNTQTFLVMAHDDSNGRIHLEDDRARISWPEVGSQEIFERIDAELRRATAALGGTYIKNPIWTERFGKGLVTVHPLGGCGMADSAEDGVVDHMGRVFAGESGEEVYDGLFVSDGSVIPRSVGVNPFLTISTLAERSVALLAGERDWSFDCALPSRPRDDVAAPSIGIQFTETMRGFFCADPDVDFETAAERGKADDCRLEFTVTVNCDDCYRMLSEPDHQAAMYGTVTIPTLSEEPLTVTNGIFQLLVVDREETRTRRMNYWMPMHLPDGRQYFLHGYKRIRDDKGFDLWADTTTLFVTVYEGDDESGPVAGKALLRIKTKDFAKQMRTLKVTNAPSMVKRLKALTDFGKFFAGALYDTYGPKGGTPKEI